MSQYQFMPAPSAPHPVLPSRNDNESLPVKRYDTTSKSLMGILGPALLAFLVALPIWNACVLLHDETYLFFAGHVVPVVTIWLCVCAVVLYAVALAIFFCFARKQVMTEQTLLLIVMIFVKLLGLALVMCSLPLAKQATNSYHNMMRRCDYSEQTHYLFEYSQMLQSLRQTESCRAMTSVELCSGFAALAPYTEFLKTMETTFRCSGFCYRPAELPGLASDASLLQKEDESATLAAEASMRNTFGDMYPPTLFSNDDWKMSCEGMAARDMKHLAGDISYQNFLLGCYLLVIAIATGFLKLSGMCILKDRDTHLRHYY